nr:MAG TPA: hypothetical protein [Caudoviricetes sp.]
MPLPRKSQPFLFVRGKSEKNPRKIHRTVTRKIRCNQYQYHHQYHYHNNKKNIRKTAVCGLASVHTSEMYELHKK